MTAANWTQLVALVTLVVVATPILGGYMAKVYGGGAAPGDRVFSPVERGIYRLTGVDPGREQRWTVYAVSVLAFSLASVLLLYLLQRVQDFLPGNPTGVGNVVENVAFNTAASFTTNTNWQAYGGESTMSHLTQMAGLTVQNFVSAAVGMAVAIALVRALIRRRQDTIGNFWVDLTRSITRILLLIAVVGALVFVSQGVVQTLGGFAQSTSLEGVTQVVFRGPVASQEVIKELGTNGGGPMNANSAHPFENPNGFTNLLQMFLILLIPFALTYTFGKLVEDRRQGWVIFTAMFTLWISSVGLAVGFETAGNPELNDRGVEQAVTSESPGGNLEGKEVRFGPTASGIFAATTTGTSTGAVNSAHDSYTPAGGAVPMFNMMLGEVSPGGVGAGIYGMLVFVIIAVFIAGLMVGRTPEYLGKKIQAAEVKLATLYILAVPLVVLGFAGAAVLIDTAAGSVLNTGPHGLSEIIYSYVSTANNNGSAFAGITVNTDWYTVTHGLSMLAGRFLLIVPVLAIAGSLARKQTVPASEGTFPTGTPLYRAAGC